MDAHSPVPHMILLIWQAPQAQMEGVPMSFAIVSALKAAPVSVAPESR